MEERITVFWINAYFIFFPKTVFVKLHKGKKTGEKGTCIQCNEEQAPISTNPRGGDLMGYSDHYRPTSVAW